jgi:uncharacterized Rossmann fold enzyme
MMDYSNFSHMMISGWNSRYNEILKEFNYIKKDDIDSAKLLDSLLGKEIHMKKIIRLIKNQNVFVVGSGPSLSYAVPILQQFKKTVKIVADSAVKYLIENGITPDIIVTDLDGDEEIFRKIGNSNIIFVVHAHGDNISRLNLIKKFKNCIGTTQTKPFGKLHNFGGFTDGDRAVFLASYFNAKNIILFGMDFGKRIGTFSNTQSSEKVMKRKKLEKGKSLLEWLAVKTKSDLFTTSSSIVGFKKISYQNLDIIIT